MSWSSVQTGLYNAVGNVNKVFGWYSFTNQGAALNFNFEPRQFTQFGMGQLNASTMPVTASGFSYVSFPGGSSVVKLPNLVNQDCPLCKSFLNNASQFISSIDWWSVSGFAADLVIIGADIALGGPTGESIPGIAARKTLWNNLNKKGITVLGSYNQITGGYISLAKKLKANYFSIPEKIWENMDDIARWTANRKFLDRAIKRGDDFILSTSAFAAREGTWFFKELQYLYSKGYKVAKDGMSLIKP